MVITYHTTKHSEVSESKYIDLSATQRNFNLLLPFVVGMFMCMVSYRLFHARYRQ